MASVTEIADDYWAALTCHEPYYAVMAGEPPTTIEKVDETTIGETSAEARQFLDRLGTTVPASSEADLTAVLETHLVQQAARIDEIWHIHPTAPYQSYGVSICAQQVIAPQPPAERRRLTAELVAMIDSIAGIVREQRARGIALPRPAVPAARATWEGLRRQLPTVLSDESLAVACGEVLTEIEASAEVAGDEIGMAHLPGGEAAYRSLVRHQTTLEMEPEELHQLGLAECARLTEQMTELRARLGGPAEEDAGLAWIQAQAHLFASTPEDVAARYRRHIERVEQAAASLFRTFPAADYDVRRADPAVEAGMTYGYYQAPTPDEPVGLYRFNASDLDSRPQLTSAALILHELVPGHHFHIARQRENQALHPLQQHSLELNAFNEGWGEYASGLGWEIGAYDDAWDAYGRLAHERFTAQRLVVDTALNLGLWDRERATAFMRANTLESDAQIDSEIVRYATDMPAQALAYRGGFLAFQKAREAAGQCDIRDIHEAMIGGGAVPLPRMQERVRVAAQVAADVSDL